MRRGAGPWRAKKFSRPISLLRFCEYFGVKFVMRITRLSWALMALFTCTTPALSLAEDLRIADPDEIFNGADVSQTPTIVESPRHDDVYQDLPTSSEGLIPANWIISSNTAYADVMMDFDENLTSKAIDQLLFRKNGTIKSGKFYLSGVLKGSYAGEWTNTSDAFPILTRFPSHADGKEHHDVFLDNAALALTATATDWLTLFARLEYHENRFDTQDPWQLRKIYATIGDLNRAPFYLSVGRKTIKFGDFDIYTPFTQNINNHFFRAESDDLVAELGFVNRYVQLAATAISGGRHTRTADTADDGGIENFAIDGDVFIPMMNGTLKLGGGYLHGTIYNHTLPHHPGPDLDCPVMPGASGVPKCRGRNAAFDLRAEFTSERLDLMAEYTATIDPWPATGQKLKSWTVQGRYKTEVMGSKTHLSLSYSRSDIGPFSTGGPGAPIFDEIEQIVAGAEIFIHPNMSLGIEYSHNKGFAPLVNITNTAKDAESDQIILGARIVF